MGWFKWYATRLSYHNYEFRLPPALGIHTVKNSVQAKWIYENMDYSGKTNRVSYVNTVREHWKSLIGDVDHMKRSL